MRLSSRAASIVLLSVVLSGCSGGSGESRGPLDLGHPETFTWAGGQPVSFSTPPQGWQRSRYQNGGTEGVDFVKSGSVGEQIFVAERLFVGRHDHCAKIREMLDGLLGYDRSTFPGAITKARAYAKEPFNATEERMIPIVNDALDRARAAYLNDDLAIAQVELTRALDQAGKIRVTLEETIDRALFTAEGNSVYPALQVGEPSDGELTGEPAVLIDFTFQAHGSTLLGRRIYVVKNNRMFELGYQGLEENLALFEAVAASLDFPPGPCEH